MASRGARVVCNAWGSTEDEADYTTATAEIDAMAFARPHLLIVFAAGNTGMNKAGRTQVWGLSTLTTQVCTLSLFLSLFLSLSSSSSSYSYSYSFSLFCFSLFCQPCSLN